MVEVIHGGDIYQNQVHMDFSVNTNPLGIPDKVQEALFGAVESCQCYPDIQAAKLIAALSRETGMDVHQIVCGNGASELFMAIVHAWMPEKILIPVPSFYGYERAARASGAEIIFYELREADGFQLTEEFLQALTEDLDLVMLANPNNPVGNALESGLVRRICQKCRQLGITVVLDECFLEFTGKRSLFQRAGEIRWDGSETKVDQLEERLSLEEYPNVMIVRAFTKIYAIPGVRLGYLLCGQRSSCERIQAQLPEWNLSTFAQMAGAAALQETDYVKDTVAYVEKEREYLTEQLQSMGVKVWPSAANFLLLKSEAPLYQGLLEQKILIRDCRNFRGLGGGFYRIAVKTHKENQMLIEKVGEILGRD